jgi:hypothetical protein
VAFDGPDGDGLGADEPPEHTPDGLIGELQVRVGFYDNGADSGPPQTKLPGADPPGGDRAEIGRADHSDDDEAGGGQAPEKASAIDGPSAWNRLLRHHEDVHPWLDRTPVPVVQRDDVEPTAGVR